MISTQPLQSLMTRLGVTQTSLAEHIGVHLRTVQRWFHRQEIPMDKLIDAYEFLKRDVYTDYPELESPRANEDPVPYGKSAEEKVEMLKIKLEAERRVNYELQGSKYALGQIIESQKKIIKELEDKIKMLNK